MTFSTAKKIALIAIFATADRVKGIRLSVPLGKRTRAAMESHRAAQAGAVEEVEELEALQEADPTFFNFLTNLDEDLDFPRGLGPGVNDKLLARCAAAGVPKLSPVLATGLSALNHPHQDGRLDPPSLRRRTATGGRRRVEALQRPALRRLTATGRATEQQRRMRHLQFLMQQVEHIMQEQRMEGSVRGTPTLSVEAGAGSSLSPSNGSRARTMAADTNESAAKRPKQMLQREE